ncbi:uncharacterized protein LOC113234516 isoform X2 [Hyposmocoma kahamanoa]|uniref:uncharacterized protein LOC113234516 isoform X2 n=1 Tax=Hyposmocoma kahamanoa TaxID=1477025 RepID=UPI000E6D97E8|nr:uncharacterized protein LOC113234516 isoform X2 [Hyposmocoma kahamanoa]
MEQMDTVEIEPELNVDMSNTDAIATEVTTNVSKDVDTDAEKLDNKRDNDDNNEVTMCSFDLNKATCSSRKRIPFSRSKSCVSEYQNKPHQIRGISKASYTSHSTDSDYHTSAPHFLISSTSCTSAGPLNPHPKVCITSSDRPLKVSYATSQPLRIPSPTRGDSFTTVSAQPIGSFSNLPSPTSLVINVTNQPPSLFILALSKLNENPVSLALLNKALRSGAMETSDSNLSTGKMDTTAELSAPASLTSAPPSYSFVLRQMAARRPRLMGTFIPSPSFVQHTPPPNYAAAFDIYVEPAMPPQNPTRVYSFGFTSMPAVCPECGYTGLTTVTAKITICTHLCAMFLCLFCCWACAPLPYVLRSCKDVYHYCTNCRNLLGIYCPTNPERRLPETIRRY